MKQMIVLCCILAMAACIRNEKSQPKVLPENRDLYAELMAPQAQFDSVFAQKLSADGYGMKKYVMAFLKKGPKRDQDSVTVAQLQKAHLENIGRMAESGKLVLAGPFEDDGEVRGIYIFNVESVAEAQALTASDPAIQAGRLAMELHPWYGTAVLPVIVPLHNRLKRTSITK
jgi:uncharacterized protein YciI